MRARRAGDGPPPPETEEPRRWDENGRGGIDIVMDGVVVGAAVAVTRECESGCCWIDGGRVLLSVLFSIAGHPAQEDSVTCHHLSIFTSRSPACEMPDEKHATATS